MCPRGSWVPLVLALNALACSSDPALLAVDLITDYVAGTEVTSFRAEIRDGAGVVVLERTILACVEESARCDFLSGARLAEVGDLPTGTYHVVAEAFRAGAPIARREVVVTLARDQVVTLVMARSCEGVSCAGGEDCVAGVCQPLGCSVETPELCREQVECVSAAECPGASPTACEVARCVGGRCLLGGNASACGAGDWCDPLAGCVPSSSDPSCSGTPDADTVALYTFDADVGTNAITDATGDHSGVIMIPGGARFTVGPEGCGSALSFTSSSQTDIPDDPAWDLTEGSIDFRIWHDGQGLQRGVLSRDARGTSRSGHLTVAMDTAGAIMARFQMTGDGGGWVRCGPTLSPQTWHHIGINFGAPAPELWVDGERIERADGQVGIWNSCATVPTMPWGLANPDGDNDNPWLLGAHRASSLEGVSDPGLLPFVGGAIDQLRISRVQRDFSTL